MNEAKTYLPITDGMRLGLKVSLTLAGAYAVLGIMFEVGRQSWLMQELRFTSLPLVRAAGMLPFGFLFALIPTLTLGTVTGGLIGELWRRIGWRANSRVFALLMLVLCALIAAGLHIVFRIEIDLTIPKPQLEGSEYWIIDGLGALISYPYLLGIPSILYVLAGAWCGYDFWWRQTRPTPDLGVVETRKT